MRLICPWCASEGKRAFVGIVAPLIDLRRRYGICRGHKDDLLSQAEEFVRERRAPATARVASPAVGV